jgi:uncharacterized RDD family membrane protein YckC
MPAVKVLTNFNIDLEFQIPEFWRRLLSWIIDVIIQYLYIRIAGAIYSSIGESSNPFDTDSQYNMHWLNIIFWLPIFVYHLVCEITLNGQSIGKKIMGIRVVNENGGRPSLSQFIIRWLIRTADIMIIIILLLNVLIFLYQGLIWALIGSVILLLTDVILVVSSKKGQRLGDILAKTMLIHTKASGNLYDTVFQEVADNYLPSFPQIMKLSDRDINSIKSILDTARKKGDFNMAANASEKIKAHLKIDSALSPFDFLEIALKDYNYLSTK